MCKTALKTHNDTPDLAVSTASVAASMDKEREIMEGTVSKWIEENKNNRPSFNKAREEVANHPIEKVGKQLRSMMSWLKNK